ncbi:hypothetical protein XFF6166_850004 [Xanthomonas citri pv. fuscans]|nr:hypothetical protein XFF6166_850004 [Xanthomonas citri pv. fuscans]SOO46056.1 hypothetical protein XFF1815_950005 [Xanthomonas citri pv. fuscans]
MALVWLTFLTETKVQMQE